MVSERSSLVWSLEAKEGISLSSKEQQTKIPKSSAVLCQEVELLDEVRFFISRGKKIRFSRLSDSRGRGSSFDFFVGSILC